jgi:hypothetical protein
MQLSRSPGTPVANDRFDVFQVQPVVRGTTSIRETTLDGRPPATKSTLTSPDSISLPPHEVDVKLTLLKMFSPENVHPEM